MQYIVGVYLIHTEVNVNRPHDATSDVNCIILIRKVVACNLLLNTNVYPPRNLFQLCNFECIRNCICKCHIIKLYA